MTKDERNKIKGNVETKETNYFSTILLEVEGCLKKHPKPLFPIMNLIIKYRNQARKEILGSMDKISERREAEFKKTVETESRKNSLI